MVDETHACFRELLRRDLGVEYLVSGDFAMVNARLAEHYQIPGVEGVEIQQVPLPSGSPRGGFLTQTSVLNLGNANSHDNKNMPIILAGGGFRHGQHLAFDRRNKYPLPNLYVSMLQRLGIETDRCASSTGTLRGLEPA